MQERPENKAQPASPDGVNKSGRSMCGTNREPQPLTRIDAIAFAFVHAT